MGCGVMVMILVSGIGEVGVKKNGVFEGVLLIWV